MGYIFLLSFPAAIVLAILGCAVGKNKVIFIIASETCCIIELLCCTYDMLGRVYSDDIGAIYDIYPTVLFASIVLAVVITGINIITATQIIGGARGNEEVKDNKIINSMSLKEEAEKETGKSIIASNDGVGRYALRDKSWNNVIDFFIKVAKSGKSKTK